MYIAGRTRTASSPSRMRIASTPYSAVTPLAFLSSVSLMSPVARFRSGGAADRALRDLVDAPQRAEALRPAGVRRRHPGLTAPRAPRAERARSLFVELRIQIVEQRHRRAARLLAQERQARERQRQQQAAPLPRGPRLARVLTVDQQLDLVTLRPRQAAASRALARQQLTQLLEQPVPALRLARAPRPRA